MNVHRFGIELFDQICSENKKLLISEDVAFISHLKVSVSEDAGSSTSSGIASLSECAAVAFVSGTVATVARVASPSASSTNGAVYVPVASLASLCLYLGGKHFLERYLSRRLTKQILQFTKAVQSIKLTIRKLMHIVQEADVLEKKIQTFAAKSTQIRCSLGTNCHTIFSELRLGTQKLRDELHNNTAEFDDEANSLCSLPIETFEELLGDGVLAVNQLKSLTQLIRLQMSEFLRRLICSFLFSAQHELSYSAFHTLSIKIISITSNLTCALQQSANNLAHLKEYYEALWYSESTFSSRSNEVLFDTHAQELCYHIKSIDTSFKSSLLRLENVLDACETQSTASTKKNICDMLDESIGEFDASLAALKSLRKHHFKEVFPEKGYPIVMPAKSETIATMPVKEEQEPPKADYEVFEDDSASVHKVDDNFNKAGEDQDWESNKRIGLAVSLNSELKQALLVKAQEHRGREAKALGVPIESLPSVQIARDDETESRIESRAAAREAVQEDARERMLEVEMHQVMNGSNFATQLARIAVQKSKGFGVGCEEESFGDSDDNSDVDGEA